MRSAPLSRAKGTPNKRDSQSPGGKGCYPAGIGQQNREKHLRPPIAVEFVIAKSQGAAQESKIRELGTAIKYRVVGPLWALHLYTTRMGQRYLEQ